VTDQMERVSTPPVSNEAGVALALKQVERGALKGGNWRPSYDAKTDTLFLRRWGGANPSVSYYVPDHPEVLLSLSVATGELTGVDLTSFRRVLVKTDPVFEPVWRAVRLLQAADHLPLFLKRILASVSPRQKVGARVGDGILRGVHAA
jgi:hypothetical protein